MIPRILIISLLVCFVLSGFSGADSKKGKHELEFYNHDLEIAALPVFMASFNLRYEYAISDFLGVFAGAGISPAGSPFLFNEEEKANLDNSFYDGTAGVCLYPIDAFSGFYIQADASIYRIKLTEKDTQQHASFTRYIAPGMMLGWKWRATERFVIRLGGGSGYGSGGDMTVENSTMAWNDVQAKFDFNLGILF